ncbi:MAG: ethanolamine ammonia-lyase light chain EutC, partial [Hyphomicrobiaceae bacterium]
MSGSGPPRDPWSALGLRTPARIAIGRAGASLPTREVLSFALAHARARDAVHARLDAAAMRGALELAGHRVIEVVSEAPDRATYLRRPDLGRRLAPAERQRLADVAPSGGCDLAVMIGDGLSATAVAAHA